MGSGFPRWLAPVTRIVLSALFMGGYIVLFIWGLWLGAFENGHGAWPHDDERLQQALAALGGIAATFFTVALNLPRDEGGNSGGDGNTGGGGKPHIVPVPNESAGILIRKTGIAAASHAAARVLGLVRKPDWDGHDERVLVVLGTALVLLFPLFTLVGLGESIFRAERDVPAFIAKFSAPGFAILLTAVTVSASRLTRPK